MLHHCLTFINTKGLFYEWGGILDQRYKYKIGEEVVIRNDLDAETLYAMDDGSIRYYPGTIRFRGATATIMGYHANAYIIDLDDRAWCWTDEMFEDTRWSDVQIPPEELMGFLTSG